MNIPERDMAPPVNETEDLLEAIMKIPNPHNRFDAYLEHDLVVEAEEDKSATVRIKAYNHTNRWVKALLDARSEIRKTALMKIARNKRFHDIVDYLAEWELDNE